MVYRFILVSDEVSAFSREIEIDADSTFLDLRDAILDSVNYTKDELDSFYICTDGWQKGTEVTLEDMGNTASDEDLWLMEDTELTQLVDEVGQRLIFVFDYMTERAFFLELKEIIPNRHLKEPVCTLRKGNAPAQIVDLDEFEKKIDIKMSEKVDLTPVDPEIISEDEEFNEEDFADGYDIIDDNI